TRDSDARTSDSISRQIFPRKHHTFVEIKVGKWTRVTVLKMDLVTAGKTANAPTARAHIARKVAELVHLNAVIRARRAARARARTRRNRATQAVANERL
ncbi:hypothetical protein PO909_024098, partial [Leuciscus waleckii]